MATYDRQRLLYLATKAVGDREAQRRQRHVQATGKWRAELDAWLASEAKVWQAEARYVLECIRKGRAPRRERTQMLRSWGPSPRPELADPGHEERVAAAMVTWLSSVTDETVTSAAIERAGFRNVAWLLS